MAKKTWNQHMLDVYRKNKKMNKDYKLGDAMKEAKKTWNKVKGGEEMSEKDDMMKEGKKDDMKKGGFVPEQESIDGLSPASVHVTKGGKSQKRKSSKSRKTRKNNKSQKRI